MDKKRFEKVGQHWSESIGIKGFPQNYFEVRHRTESGVHFVDDIMLAGPHGKRSIFGEMGIESPHLVVDPYQMPRYNFDKDECIVQGVRNIPEVLIAMHEAAHRQQDEESKHLDALDPSRERYESAIGVKRHLEKKGIKINLDETKLEKADGVFNEIARLLRENPKDERIPELKIELDQLGGAEQMIAFRQIGNAINEQGATRRSLSAMGRLADEFGIDLSAIRTQVPKDFRPGRTSGFSMHSWYDSEAFFATLDVGLASHGADVPLGVLCKRLLGDACEFSVPEELANLRFQPRVFKED